MQYNFVVVDNTTCSNKKKSKVIIKADGKKYKICKKNGNTIVHSTDKNSIDLKIVRHYSKYPLFIIIPFTVILHMFHYIESPTSISKHLWVGVLQVGPCQSECEVLVVFNSPNLDKLDLSAFYPVSVSVNGLQSTQLKIDTIKNSYSNRKSLVIISVLVLLAIVVAFGIIFAS